LFRDGSYEAVSVEGTRADHVVAFEREKDGSRAVVVVPRLVAGWCDPQDGRLQDGAKVWQDTRLSLDGAWRNVVTGERVAAVGDALAVASLFSYFPVAVLFGSSEDGTR
jgi:(1->4)-alpha-D-glucan 1-alpha-D-glucosylmutase